MVTLPGYSFILKRSMVLGCVVEQGWEKGVGWRTFAGIPVLSCVCQGTCTSTSSVYTQNEGKNYNRQMTDDRSTV